MRPTISRILLSTGSPRRPRRLLAPTVAVAIGMLLASGCSHENASQPTNRHTPTMAFALRYPTGDAWSAAVGAAQQETLHVWLAALGTSAASAQSARPAPDDSLSSFAAHVAVTESSVVVLDVTLTQPTEWWRVFVRQAELQGSTTLRLTNNETARSAQVVFCDPTARQFQVVAYRGLLATDATSPPAIPFAGGDLPAGTMLFPIGIINPGPIDGIEMRFTLSQADSAALYLDPGSRLIVAGDEGAFGIEVEPVADGGDQGGEYVLIIYPRLSGGEGAEIAIGSWDGILFYIAAFGETSERGLWIDPERAYFSQDQGEVSIQAAVYNMER